MFYYVLLFVFAYYCSVRSSADNDPCVCKNYQKGNTNINKKNYIYIYNIYVYK